MHIQNRPRKPLLSSCNRRGPVSIEALEQRIAPAAFVVSTTADGGIGSLRQALLDAAANGSTSADTITFNINDTSGPVKLIRPGTPLPDVSVGVLIDGYTQNGSSRNTLDVGNNAILNVVLDGSLLGPANGLRLLGDDTVTGLVIHGFNSTSAITGNGILVEGDNGNNVIVGNWIGVDQTGTIARGNAQAGIALRDAGPGNQIGSSAAADRNVISGNSVGIELFAVTATGTKNTLITNNFIGTDKSGTADLGNIADGVRILGNNNFVVGNVLRGNVISGNDGNGIQIRNPAPAVSGNRIFANLIGATQAGTALGNSSSGILINNSGDNLIGMAGANGELNVVAYNGGNGITMTGAQGTPNPIRGNSIFGNGGLGIDLGSDGITLNDSGDGDAG
ncbi:MAG: right-handed parallel beta-helix repeat-containing protein, partial [Verrucomicrobiota bacterium]